MNKKVTTLVLAVCLLASAGCFDIEQTITLQKDLSGKAGFSMKVDMEPMVVFMTRMQREMAGQTGEISAADLEKAKKEFLASRKTETSEKPDPAEVQKNLPAGVKLLDTSFKEDGLKILANFAFGFDNVSKLGQIKFPKKEGDEGGPPGTKNPFDEPFAGLKIKDEGKTLLLTSEAVNPAAESKAQASEIDMSPEAKKQIEDAFKGLRFAVKIDAPFEVLEHNATRKEGHTLIWEYDLKSMEKMTPEQLAQGVRVRFKK